VLLSVTTYLFTTTCLEDTESTSTQPTSHRFKESGLCQ